MDAMFEVTMGAWAVNDSEAIWGLCKDFNRSL
jgi:hypothetical protein